MYKDKDKQREANKLAMRRARASKGNTKHGIKEGNTGYPRVTDQEFTNALAQAEPGVLHRVSKPGDPDYVPQCETTKAFVEAKPKSTRFPTHKRGLDIKEFNDLPLDVQQTIRTVSDSNEEFQRRTGIAIRYQHVFPERFTP